MSNIVPSKPSFFTYWRPWNENADLFESYNDYVKDTSLVKYGSDIIGQYINQASKEQVESINRVGRIIGNGLGEISNKLIGIGNQLDTVNYSLSFLNRNLDILIEQSRLSNVLLQNIAELLRVPDSEKERQHSIELGLKFFVNAQKDPDLYADALEELEKAETLMKQDYFVLHRIGLIYLHIEKFLNPIKAVDYFARAGKYASVESDPNAVKLANILNKKSNGKNSAGTNNTEAQLSQLAADSYEKAAFASYTLGLFDDAINYQKKALKNNYTLQYQFLLAKYQIRGGLIDEGLANLNHCIDEDSNYASAVFLDIDIINENKVHTLLLKKDNDINTQLKELAVKWKKTMTSKSALEIKKLNNFSSYSYFEKRNIFIDSERELAEIETIIITSLQSINLLILQIKNDGILGLDENRLHEIIYELEKSKSMPIEEMRAILNKSSDIIESQKLKIGSRYAGGIVFYIDETCKHGLVCAEEILERVIWGNGYGVRKIETNFGIGNGIGMQNTNNIVEHLSWKYEKGFWSGRYQMNFDKPEKTGARLCRECRINGYDDWYLPTIDELRLIYNNLHKTNIFRYPNRSYMSSVQSRSKNIFVGFQLHFEYGEIKNNEDWYTYSIFGDVITVRAF